MNYAVYTPMLLLLPLLCFAVLGIWGKKYLSAISGVAGTTVALGLFAIAVWLAWHYFFADGMLNGSYQSIIALQTTWLSFAYQNLSIDIGLLLDPIAVMMLVVVTLVNLMVHVFSMGYMKDESRLHAYYAFLSLFTFSMLGLVLSSNIFQIYIFWELVGLSSYLLIGFYFTKPSAVAAAKKAFIVTRFADFGFLIGILMLGIQGGSFDFLTLIERLTDSHSEALMSMASTGFLGISSITWALVLVFMGGAGKSAMFPLHVWLPDAMEGPTPVSALIHAATMVVAGVFLVARLFPVYHHNGVSLHVVAWVGAFSAIFAAIIACTQTDIKRVLAYSTMSQIGYMMFALGVSDYGGENGLGFNAGMFHLFTHAFFKSLLFLCAGSVIHAVHSNEMKDMGGLRKAMPVTHISFLIACLAIAGMPPLSGFFSKEEILLAAWNGNKAIYFVGLITSGITAFYMFRLYYRIFWSEPNKNAAHEGSWSMQLPLLVLAVLSIVAGFLPFSTFVSSDSKPITTGLHLGFSIAPVLLIITGIALATYLYKNGSAKTAKLKKSFAGIYHAANQRFYIDSLYLFFARQVMQKNIGRMSAWVDKHIVDGGVNAIGETTSSTAHSIKGLQSGNLQHYTWIFFTGALILCLVFIYLWTT